MFNWPKGQPSFVNISVLIAFFRMSYVRPLPSLRLRALPHRGFAASGGSRIRIGGRPHRPPPEPPPSPRVLGVRVSAPPKAAAVFFSYVRPLPSLRLRSIPLRGFAASGVSRIRIGGRPRRPPPEPPSSPRVLGVRDSAPPKAAATSLMLSAAPTAFASSADKVLSDAARCLFTTCGCKYSAKGKCSGSHSILPDHLPL